MKDAFGVSKRVTPSGGFKLMPKKPYRTFRPRKPLAIKDKIKRG